MTDVTGRDGFQMEKQWIETEDKVRILSRIMEAGIRRMEVTSFVSPKAIPQMRDAKEVLKLLDLSELEVVALVPNIRGAMDALEAGVDEVNAVLSISETHNRKNVNKSVDQSLAQVGDIFELTEQKGKKMNVSLGTTFGCPFEGLYPPGKVGGIVERIADMGVDRITLADTTGMANPSQISDFVKKLKEEHPGIHFSLHLHNTRGMGLANLVAGYDAGIRHFDAALGGIGGCPFAPGATGNVCLEDVAHMLHFMGIPIDPDLNKLIEAAKEMEKVLGYTLPGQVMKAGLASDVIVEHSK